MSLISDIAVIDNTLSEGKLWCDLCEYILVTHEDMQLNKKKWLL